MCGIICSYNLIGVTKVPLSQSIINRKCFILKNIIIEKSNEIKAILQDYESDHVADYEINRVLLTLQNIEVKTQYAAYTVSSLSTFLPSNLPFYSLVLFGIIPSFQVEQNVLLKPNQEMRDKQIIQRIAEVIGLENLFENIRLIDMSGSEFIQTYCGQTEVMIFTGYQKNKDKILSQMPKNSLLIFNGSGHNPFVITESADLGKAVKDAVYTKFFNTGQDCAAPDAILVHTSVYKQFLQSFIEETRKLNINNSYSAHNTDIGPIYRLSELQKFLTIIFNTNPEHILAGGMIDIKNRIVIPTVIASHITEHFNLDEIFGPVAFIHEYDNDEQLKLYFEDESGRYKANKMYVSLYGDSPYISTHNDEILPEKNGAGIVLYNQTVHDYERGYRAYGGYSTGASGFIFKDSKNHCRSYAQPVYVPEVISLFVKNKYSSLKISAPHSLTIKIQENISNIFKKEVSEIFGNNLLFAFIFGSVAKLKARLNTTNASDLDTFICLKEIDEGQIKRFYQWLIKFQYMSGLKPDFDYLAEIVTQDQLEANLDQAIKETPMLSSNDEQMFDSIIWLDALKFNKIGVIKSAVNYSQADFFQ